MVLYGIRQQAECYKCRRTNWFSSEDEHLETKQFGCNHCNKKDYPKYRADYNSDSNVWVIFKQYYKPCKSFFGFGPIKDYLVEEVLRVDYEFTNNSRGPELEFDTLKEAKLYIKNNLVEKK